MWTQRADFGAVGRHRATGLSIGNKGYMGLGHYNGTGVETYLADWWEYDPASNSWTQKADYIGNNGNGELGAHGISSGLVGYVGLGEIDDFSMYKFDPATNSWSQVSSAPPGNTFQDTGSFTIGHKSYFTKLSSTNFYVYNADIDTWSQLGPLPFVTFYSAAGFSIDGKGYFKISNSTFAVNQFWEYNPTSDTWTEKAVFPGKARLASNSFVQNGKGFIVCGYGVGAYSDLTKEVWSYNPVLNVWDSLPEFQGTSRRYSTGFSIGEHCYIGTGTNGTNFSDFWEFDEVADIHEKDEFSFSVFPNPATDKFSIQSTKTNEFNVSIFSTSGKLIKKVETNNGKIDVMTNGILSGQYIIQINVDNSVVKTERIHFL